LDEAGDFGRMKNDILDNTFLVSLLLTCALLWHIIQQKLLLTCALLWHIIQQKTVLIVFTLIITAQTMATYIHTNTIKVKNATYFSHFTVKE